MLKVECQLNVTTYHLYNDTQSSDRKRVLNNDITISLINKEFNIKSMSTFTKKKYQEIRKNE